MPHKIISFDRAAGIVWLNEDNALVNDNSAADSNGVSDPGTIDISFEPTALPPTDWLKSYGEFVKVQFGIKLDDDGISGDDDSLSFTERSIGSNTFNSFTTKADAAYTAQKWYWYDSTLATDWEYPSTVFTRTFGVQSGGADDFTWYIYVIAQKIFYRRHKIKASKRGRKIGRGKAIGVV